MLRNSQFKNLDLFIFGAVWGTTDTCNVREGLEVLCEAICGRSVVSVKEVSNGVMEIDWFCVFVNLKALKDTPLASYHVYNKVWCGFVTSIEES